MLTLRDTGRLHCGAIRNVRFRCHSTVDILPSRQSTVAGVLGVPGDLEILDNPW